MATYSFTAFAVTQFGFAAFDFPQDNHTATVNGPGALMSVEDNDGVFDDQAGDSGQTIDNSSQVLAAAFGAASAGRVVQSLATFNVTNNSTGQTGTAHVIAVFTGGNPASPQSATLGNYAVAFQRVFTIGVAPGDSLTFSNYTFVGQIPYASLVTSVPNSAPVAVDDGVVYDEDEGGSVSGNVLANDTDINSGDTLSVQTPGVLQGLFGTLTLNANGSYTYAGNQDLIDTLTGDQQDVFTYTVSDGRGGTDTATLAITIDLADDNRTINGTSGHDRLTGDRDRAGAEDTIRGGTGNDIISGLDGADDLFGGAGNDTISGGDGRDELFGESGNDALDGGAGEDVVNGGSGNDRIAGGADADRFVFDQGHGYDTITDFEVGSDRLVLNRLTIRGLASRDVDNDGVIDTIVTFSAGGGTVTLLGVSDLTADQLLNPPVPLIA